MKLATTFLTGVTGAAALIMPRAVRTVADLTELDDIIKSTAKVSTNFCAEWSGACKTIEEQYNNLSNQNKEITFVYVNIDRVGTKQAADKYKFDALPTFITFKGGEEFGNRVIGPYKTPLNDQISTLAKS